MDPKSTTVQALITLCEREGGPYAVGEIAGVSGANLWQITKGVKLPSGEPKGVGKFTAAKLTAAFPGWRDLAPKERQAPIVPATPTIHLSLTDDAVMLGGLFDKVPGDRRELFASLVESIMKARRDALQSQAQSRP